MLGLWLREKPFDTDVCAVWNIFCHGNLKEKKSYKHINNLNILYGLKPCLDVLFQYILDINNLNSTACGVYTCQSNSLFGSDTLTV